MRQAYSTIIQTDVDDFSWTHATLPQRAGGFGLRDPATIVDAARLASLVNVADRALGFGAAKGHIDTETEKAVANYVSKLGTELRPDLQPSRELQKILRNADEPARQRLNSLTTPHANAWLSFSALWNVLSQG